MQTTLFFFFFPKIGIPVPDVDVPGTISLLSNQPQDATSLIEENVDSISLIDKFI